MKYSFFKLRLIVTLVFLLGFFALSLPAQIHAIGLSHACAAIHAGAISGVAGAGGTNGFSGRANPGETLTVRVTLSTATFATFTLNYAGSAGAILAGPATAPHSLSFTVGATPPSGLGWYIQSANGSVNVTADCGFGAVSLAGGPLFDDGRLNDADAVETSAVYCLEDGSVRIYIPGNPSWGVAFTASPAEIARVPKKPAKNTLIKEAKGARLYRLTTGELQLNSPMNEHSDYVFIFKDCPIPDPQPAR